LPTKETKQRTETVTASVKIHNDLISKYCFLVPFGSLPDSSKNKNSSKLLSYCYLLFV
jgi:hypothetical protein